MEQGQGESSNASLAADLAIYVVAITIDPNNDQIIYVGTGELDNADGNTDSFYGTGVYESQNGGLTWNLLLSNESTGGVLNTVPNPVTHTPLVNPMYGMGVSSIAVDGSSIFVADGEVDGAGLGVVNGNNGEAKVGPGPLSLANGIVQPEEPGNWPAFGSSLPRLRRSWEPGLIPPM